jgi:hypothetical protein
MVQFPYDTFTSRNAGYVTPELQERISTTRLLVAGCGVGSTIAECSEMPRKHWSWRTIGASAGSLASCSICRSSSSRRCSLYRAHGTHARQAGRVARAASARWSGAGAT